MKEIILAADEPPIADAGEDQTIQLPIDMITLSGLGSSDDVAVVAYQWALTSGDDSVILEGEDSSELTAYGLQEGEYTFTLTVRDELGQTSSDDVTVTVEGKAMHEPQKINQACQFQDNLHVHNLTANLPTVIIDIVSLLLVDSMK